MGRRRTREVQRWNHRISKLTPHPGRAWYTRKVTNMNIILDGHQNPRCEICGETIINQPVCSCGHVNLPRVLRGEFSDYEIMAAMGFGDNPQETHHNPAAWRAVNAWRPGNVTPVGYDADGDFLYAWITRASPEQPVCGCGYPKPAGYPCPLCGG